MPATIQPRRSAIAVVALCGAALALERTGILDGPAGLRSLFVPLWAIGAGCGLVAAFAGRRARSTADTWATVGLTAACIALWPALVQMLAPERYLPAAEIDHGSATATVPVGGTVRVRLASFPAIDSHWASAGLVAELRGPAGEPRINRTVLGPRSQDWDDSISVLGSGDPNSTVSLVATIELALPPSTVLPVELSGSLRGSIDHPVGSPGSRSFSTRSFAVDIPLRITVQPGSAASGTRASERIKSYGMAAAVALTALALALCHGSATWPRHGPEVRRRLGECLWLWLVVGLITYFAQRQQRGADPGLAGALITGFFPFVGFSCGLAILAGWVDTRQTAGKTTAPKTTSASTGPAHRHPGLGASTDSARLAAVHQLARGLHRPLDSDLQLLLQRAQGWVAEDDPRFVDSTRAALVELGRFRPAGVEGVLGAALASKELRVVAAATLAKIPTVPARQLLRRTVAEGAGKTGEAEAEHCAFLLDVLASLGRAGDRELALSLTPRLVLVLRAIERGRLGFDQRTRLEQLMTGAARHPGVRPFGDHLELRVPLAASAGSDSDRASSLGLGSNATEWSRAIAALETARTCLLHKPAEVGMNELRAVGDLLELRTAEAHHIVLQEDARLVVVWTVRPRTVDVQDVVQLAAEERKRRSASRSASSSR